MRIELVSHYDLTVPGGVQQQVAGLAGALVSIDDANRVLVVAPGAARAQLAPGVQRVDVGRSIAVAVNGSRAPVAPQPSAWRRTVAALAQFHPDVVHLHEPLVPGPCMACLRAPTSPVVATFHRAGASTSYRLAASLLGSMLAHISLAVAVSEEAARTLRSVAGGAVQLDAVIPNAVALDRFAGATPEGSPRPTVVFVGRHEARKGLAVLIEALPLLGQSVRVRIVGDGPERVRLRSATHADGRVEWLGRVGDDELAAIVAGADVLVAPSRSGESFGVVLLEAMAAGTAVVASDLPGYRLAAGDAALYVAPGDASELAGAIGRVLADDPLRLELVARGRRLAAGHDFSGLAAAYLTRYRRLVAGGEAR